MLHEKEKEQFGRVRSDIANPSLIPIGSTCRDRRRLSHLAMAEESQGSTPWVNRCRYLVYVWHNSDTSASKFWKSVRRLWGNIHHILNCLGFFG